MPKLTGVDSKYKYEYKHKYKYKMQKKSFKNITIVEEKHTEKD